METFLGGVAILAVSGLAIVAYRHPQGFQRLGMGVMLVITLSAVGWYAYACGITSANISILHSAAVVDSLSPLSSVSRSINRLSALQSRSIVVGLALAGASAYLLFLLYLPDIIHVRNEAASGQRASIEDGSTDAESSPPKETPKM